MFSGNSIMCMTLYEIEQYCKSHLCRQCEIDPIRCDAIFNEPPDDITGVMEEYIETGINRKDDKNG